MLPQALHLLLWMAVIEYSLTAVLNSIKIVVHSHSLPSFRSGQVGRGSRSIALKYEPMKKLTVS